MSQTSKPNENGIPRPLHFPTIPNESDVAVAMNKVETEQPATLPRKKRICRFPGCTKMIKSHGHCQKHGAKPKRCKIPGCEAQRQSGYDDMCKRHWRYLAAPPEMRKEPPKTPEEKRMVDPRGKSVYDDILPASFAWRGAQGGKYNKINKAKGEIKEGSDSISNEDGEDLKMIQNYNVEYTETLPLAKFLEDNSHLEAGWHRKNECLAKGLMPPPSLKCKLKVWEKQIAITEMALLVGFKEEYQRMLAHAWGRDQNQFRKHLIGSLCSRRGELTRKRRSDFGSKLPYEKRVKATEKALATRKWRQEEAMQKQRQHEQQRKDLNQLLEDNDMAKLISVDGVQHDSEV